MMVFKQQPEMLAQLLWPPGVSLMYCCRAATAEEALLMRIQIPPVISYISTVYKNDDKKCIFHSFVYYKAVTVL